MRARREKGLCYSCDEIFKPNHKCKQQQLFMLALEEEDEEEFHNYEIVFVDGEIEMEISIHALCGNVNPYTILIQGKL